VEKGYVTLQPRAGVPVKAWVKGVPFDDTAREQLEKTARLPFIHKWIAAMPDVHAGIGATVGSVVPTIGAVVPAAVGVDIGCGMMASRTSLLSKDLPDDLKGIRSAIERAVPHGRTHHGGPLDRGGWSDPPEPVESAWGRLTAGYDTLLEKRPELDRGAHPIHQLGTLGGGNHFIEVCLDEEERVWFLLHSGSRGVGNRIGTRFIELAKKDLMRAGVDVPDRDLAYLSEGTEHFDEYVEAVSWAQDYARTNRELMMGRIVAAVRGSGLVPPFTTGLELVNCHHNYVAKETHYGSEVLVTRKGAIRAGKDELGIIPGSMGARSFIVRGLGNPESFESASHGAGRAYSRTEAKRCFTLSDHEAATRGVECRKDKDVLDETPAAYKPIDAVMAAQKDLVVPVHELRQVVCVKG
jgi:tRNA-splicing ligase RtcB (3'-phosphate/5'-hydroxy nucleic acid ligase)